jgi:Flp pilus assembly protein TadD
MPPPTAERRRWLLAGLAAAAAAAALYAPTLGHGFVFDDNPEVVDNAFIRSLASLPLVASTSAWKGSGDPNPLYRPLTTATYAVNHALGGLAPFGYHLVNVVLHALSSGLVVAAGGALGLSLPASAVAGLLFAVHPVHVEAVANVAGRKDLLTTAFVLLAFLAHLRGLRRGGWALAAAPLALAAAMFSKETGVAGLFLLAARDFLLGRDDWRRAPRRAAGLHLAYLAAAAAYLAARWAVVGTLGAPHSPWVENPLALVPAVVRIPTAVAQVGRGIALLLLPIRLSPDYSFHAVPVQTSLPDPLLLLAVAATLAVALLATLGPARRLTLFLGFWYAITLLPGSNLLFPVGTTFGERLLYLPSAAFCLGAGAVLGWLLDTRARGVARVAVPAALLLLSARTFAYERVWRDELTLFTEGVRVQPDSVKMQQCLGAALMERGDAAAALPHFLRALEILEGTPASLSRHRLELGVALERLGRLGEAESLYGQILRDEPAYADALWRLGVVRWSQGRRPEAVALWREAVAADPRHGRALSDLGIAALAAGDEAGAEASWLRAAQADPRLASVWLRLGDLYQRRGDVARARAAWSAFLERDAGRLPEAAAEVRRRLAASREGPPLQGPAAGGNQK